MAMNLLKNKRRKVEKKEENLRLRLNIWRKKRVILI